LISMTMEQKKPKRLNDISRGETSQLILTQVSTHDNPDQHNNFNTLERRTLINFRNIL
jgi:hypothetical protein